VQLQFPNYTPYTQALNHRYALSCGIELED